MQSDLSKRGLIKQVSGLDDETIDRLGGVTESGLPPIHLTGDHADRMTAEERSIARCDFMVKHKGAYEALSDDKPQLVDSNHPERDETRPIDTDRPESSRTGRDSGFRAYRFAGVLGIEPCGCGDRECMDGKVVDITSEVRELENRLARHEGQTNAIT